MTPLMYAAEKGHVDTVRLLLDRGAAIDMQDDVIMRERGVIGVEGGGDGDGYVH